MSSDRNLNDLSIHEKPIEEIMSESFAKYAKYIIQDRAIPDIRDGLKPVQRRIIYAMNELQLYFDRPHKKSARTVGEVIGKYHPHGDSSIYDAMVRMSQSWKTNLPLLDMHGNNGSIDGDAPAAMRYTECRLSQFGQLMIDGIKKNTVSFIPNFDDSEKEPTVLPTLLPNLLINGSTGIAAGYATNIPPFNVLEVLDAIIYRIDSPNCRLASLQAIIPGPDFPTGGMILNKEGITSAYETGKGKITIRAKIDLVSSKQAIISEIPYETNKAQIIKQIDELKDKYETLNIIEVRDESDKNGVSIALDLKHSHNFEFVKNFLFKNTQLQVAYAFNMVAIKNRKPYLMSLPFMLDAFIEHANEITIRACQFDLDKATHRLEIVKGLIKAVNLVDDVISIIKSSQDKSSAINALKTQLMFSDLQADAIVNLRLYRLSNTDVSNLKQEQTNLSEEISQLELLLNNKTARDNYIKNKLRSYKKIFNIKRKTMVSDASDKIVIDQEDVVQNKNQVIVATREGYLKNIPNKSYLANTYSDLKLKEGDLPICDFVSNMRDKVLLFTAKGNYLSIPTHKIPTCKWKEMGVHYNNIITTNEKDVVLNAFNFNNEISDDQYVVCATKQGLIKRLLIKYLSISKNAKIASYINLQPDDEVVAVLKGDKSNDANQIIGVITKNGYLSRYPINQISIVGKNASGVKSINLRNEDEVVDIFLEDLDAEFIFIGCIQGIKRIKKELIPITSRGNLGKLSFAHVKTNPIKALVATSLKHNEYMTYLASDHSWNTIKATDVPIGDDQSRVSNYKNLTFVMFNKLIQPDQNEVDAAEAKNLDQLKNNGEQTSLLEMKKETKKSEKIPENLFDQ